jgi:release factor glutamine methyltransferase
MYPETNTLPKQQPVLQGRVVDLCTGSGAVAIALKHQMPELEIWATDISVEALEVAKTNATRLLPPDASIHFCQGNLFDALLLPSACGPSFINYASPHAHFSLFTFHFSLVISNPPYIPTTEIAALSPEVLTEPILALDGGSDGLDLIRTIISKAPEFLCPGGMLLLEADPRQMETIANLFQLAGFVEIHVYKDFSNNERVISAKKK